MRILEKKYIHILGTFRIVYNFYKTQYVHVSTESKERPRVQNINWEIPIFALAEIFFLNHTFDILMYFTQFL